ncbi:YjbF family lipoprotein [Pseudoroseomonas cervicalis]|uniref:YjbF family lipoprotein n=1 Tax=Teichococcus cervicalis TaxID=204525 RepID=UPI0022F1C9D4|nr:YjbF family lipoprotein [Pseudoroseomonas cervicalis]WBV42675.1 YjbF family lipoprotein [Pseudoroseomonas cervicalis]
MRTAAPLLLALLVPLPLAGCGLEGLWPDGPPREARPDPLPELATSEDDTPSLRLSWAGGQAIALLIQQSGETRLWRSQGGLVVATEGARITATAGLRQWIAASRLDGPDPLEEPLSLAARPATLRRQLDLMDQGRQPEGMRFGMALNCRLSAAPQGSALLVSERCHGAGASFTNRYWADPATGGIWRSEQWVGEAGMMRMEVVTPPSS